ncbi:MAG: energy transducer TonB, partial [Erythrobacter sp.]
EEGTVGVRVTVTAEGRAANCRVTRSSGSSSLDEGACRSMERYARFNPALNAAGNPVTGAFATNLTYRLE